MTGASVGGARGESGLPESEPGVKRGRMIAGALIAPLLFAAVWLAPLSSLSSKAHSVAGVIVITTLVHLLVPYLR